MQSSPVKEISQPTVGRYVQFSAGFAFGGGFGFALGKVFDPSGNSNWYFNFDGNIGFGVGMGADVGTIIPTGSHQFQTDDFGGNSGSYNGGFSAYMVDLNFHTGGSIEKGWKGREKINPYRFGDMDRGYKTIQGGVGVGRGRLGGYYSFGTTKVF